MPPNDVPPRPERTATDTKLRDERLKSDEQLTTRAAAVEQNADAVIDLARDRADMVLEGARQKADDAAPDPSVRAAFDLSSARASEDHALEEERTAADEQVEIERATGKLGPGRTLTREREQTDAHLLAERERSDHSVTSRDDFLAIVSHDVRGLLGGLSMSAELLSLLTAASPAGDPMRVEAQRIRRITGRMNGLIGDLLDVVSMESGKLSVVPSRQVAAQLLTETVELFQLAADAAQIELTVKMPDLGLEARLDHKRILQVLTNLVGNAMKFTSKGGTIALRLAPTAGGVRFSVSDSGRGIPDGQLDTIFGRFSQLAQNDRRGLGLGLYIARCIVEAHGGKIWAESRLGCGSTFHFTLPDDELVGCDGSVAE